MRQQIRLRYAILLLWSSIMIAHTQTVPEIAYVLSMPRPATHLLEVEMRIRPLQAAVPTIEVHMPAWRTGRYALFDFASGVQEFRAADDAGRSLAWHKTDKETWQIAADGVRDVIVHYNVYANEFDERTRGLNEQHAFIDEAAVFMYCPTVGDVPITVTVHPFGAWHVTTGLDALSGQPFTFRAPSYQVFADCPLEVGTQREFAFEAEGKSHLLMVAGDGPVDAPAAIAELKKIVAINKAFWGALPYDRYVFMVHLLPEGRGGTEHLNSTIMQTSMNALATPASIRGFLGLVSHEYFHTWNVKQLRPAGIPPYDFSRENYAREYWIAEGTTSYYGHLLLIRKGDIPVTSALESIAQSVQQDRLRPGNRIQSLSESSFDAWVKYWRRNENAYNAESDYYDKGMDVSLLLDLAIRQRSDNRHSLDDVMRAMFERFPLAKRGYTVDDFQRVAEEMAGGSLDEFFTSYVHGTRPLPWEETLTSAGLRLFLKDSTAPAWLGVSARMQNGKSVISLVIAGSPAEDAGLSISDELVALNGTRVGAADVQSRIATLAPGDTARLSVLRENQLREFTAVLRPITVPAYRIEKVQHPTDLQRQIFESWLGTKWGN